MTRHKIQWERVRFNEIQHEEPPWVFAPGEAERIPRFAGAVAYATVIPTEDFGMEVDDFLRLQGVKPLQRGNRP